MIRTAGKEGFSHLERDQKNRGQRQVSAHTIEQGLFIIFVCRRWARPGIYPVDIRPVTPGLEIMKVFVMPMEDHPSKRTGSVLATLVDHDSAFRRVIDQELFPRCGRCFERWETRFVPSRRLEDPVQLGQWPRSLFKRSSFAVNQALDYIGDLRRADQIELLVQFLEVPFETRYLHVSLVV